MVEGEQSRKYALWLMPEGAIYAELSALIVDLARGYGSPVFKPHVTLLSPGALWRPDALRRTAAFASSLGPFRVELDSLGFRQEYYRALFIRLKESWGLLEARSRALAAFGLKGGELPSFEPHLSILYGDIEEVEKEGIIEQAGYDCNRTFRAGEVHLWQVEGPPTEWECVASYPLGTSPSNPILCD